MRKLILISAFVSAAILASVAVQAQSLGAQSLGANDAVESSGPDGAMARPQGAGKQASRSSKTRTTRRESDEAKARRIGAKYGVTW
jgi:hypothetical protein